MPLKCLESVHEHFTSKNAAITPRKIYLLCIAATIVCIVTLAFFSQNEGTIPYKRPPVFFDWPSKSARSAVQEPPKQVKKWDIIQSPLKEQCPGLNFTAIQQGWTSLTSYLFLKSKKSVQYKKILVWHCSYHPRFGFPAGITAFESGCCKENRCFLTANRSALPLKEFDAVLFQLNGLDQKKLPRERSENQRWIIYEKESPPHSAHKPEKYDGLFNWTATYRLDSDIVLGYGSVFPKEKMRWYDNVTRVRNSWTATNGTTKTKISAWFVSHCKTHSRREEYVKNLQKHIQVDIYGKCGALKCNPNGAHSCYKMLERKYKFYLSFENSFCKDYITEKFFNILAYNVVPVVMGYGTYEFHAPPYSYIDAADFGSSKALADYLKYLDNNDTAYSEYFRWKENYFVSSSIPRMAYTLNVCSLCQRLHEGGPKKVYRSVRDWYIRKAQCRPNLLL